VRPLEGLRVLDFSRVLAGPHCGRALADLGADVVKVEPPAGDLTRFATPRRASMSFYFAQQNAGKRNVSLDLTRPEATALLLRLVERSDVLLENFRPGVMGRLGLGYDEVAAVNPRLVYASISGYGQDGPWAQRRAYAVVIHAEMGMTRRSVDHRGGAPANEPFSHADVYAGLECLSGILAALYQRERTGRGQHVDVAMASALLRANEHVQLELADVDPGPEPPSLSPGGAPILTTADGRRITIAGDPVASHSFGLYCRLIGRPELAEDPRFAAVEDRKEHRAELVAELQAWAGRFPDPEALEAECAKVRMALGVVRSVEEAADSDWAVARGAIAEVGDRAGGTIRIPDAAWRFSDAEAGVAGDPAWRGEHNREVLAELGLDDTELDRLEADGVLSSRPPRRA
jgi:crotonobetainyl-CoA:carnitine CoA-transferase CaiB-like acyl-CoA transferase